MGALVVGCLLFVGLAVALSGAPFGDVIQKLLTDSFRSPTAFMETLKRFTPYAILGVGVFWGLKAGLFNIGVEGQFLVGGLAGVMVALSVGGLGGVLLGMLAGAVVGSLWALPAAWIKAYRGGHEVISTIMLNQIAVQLCSHLVSGPLMDKEAGFPTTSTVRPESMLGGVPFGPVTMSWAVPLAVLVIGLAAYWLKTTVSGFELGVTGANPSAGEFAGIEVKKTLFQAMLTSGAVAGFAGGLQGVAFEGRFFDGFSAGYGFDALGVAILAGGSPLGILPSAFGFAILGTGATSLQIDGVPKGLASVILALLVVVFAAFRYAKRSSSDA